MNHDAVFGASKDRDGKSSGVHGFGIGADGSPRVVCFIVDQIACFRRYGDGCVEMDSEDALDSSFHFSREIYGGGIKFVLYDCGGITTQSIVCIIASICVCCRKKNQYQGQQAQPSTAYMTLA